MRKLKRGKSLKKFISRNLFRALLEEKVFEISERTLLSINDEEAEEIIEAVKDEIKLFEGIIEAVENRGTVKLDASLNSSEL